MSISLSDELLSVQKNQDRNPLCRITSSKIDESIPFIGNKFSTEDTSAQYPHLIETSSGRLALSFSSDGSLLYRYSDTDKITWTVKAIASAKEIKESAIVELSNGNVGVIFIAKTLTNYEIRSMIISETGSTISEAAVVLSYDLDDYSISGISSIMLSDNSFYTAYAKSTLATEVGEIGYITSADFVSWSAETILTLTGLTATYDKDNTSLVQLVSGDILLFFDYVDYVSNDNEIKNIYFCKSSDGGISFDTPTKITDISRLGEQALHPSVGIDSNGTLTLAYYLSVNVLHMDEDEEFWCSSAFPSDLHYDGVENKLYIYNIYYMAGTHSLKSIVVIDVGTWTVEKCYSNTSNPAYNDYFASNDTQWQRHHREGHYACVSAEGSMILVIDHSTETIKEYYSKDNTTYGCQKNVDFEDLPGAVYGAWVDAVNKRLYLLGYNVRINVHRVWLGYIDLEEQPDPITGYYTWNKTFYESFTNPGFGSIAMSCFHIDIDERYLFVGFAAIVWDYKFQGLMKLYDLDTGAIIKYYYPDAYSGFPYEGISDVFYYNGHVYANFHYTARHQQEDRRGMLDIELAYDIMRYIAPTTSTKNNYALGRKCVTDDNRLIIGSADGIYIYDIASGVWSVFDNTNTPGLTVSGSNFIGEVAYDPVNDLIFATNPNSSTSWRGVMLLGEDGPLKQSKYRTAVENPEWVFTSENLLVNGYHDYEASVAISANNDLWSVWTKDTDGDLSLKWDHEDASILLHNYLTGTLQIKWEIGSINLLTFSLSQGQYFDITNLQSLLSVAVEKGRKIKVEFGEVIDGVEYYQNQGLFFVKETRLSYRRGDHPVITVTCEDITTMWDGAKIAATEYYNDENPENIISDLITTFGNLESEEIDIPGPGELEESHIVSYQWIDENLLGSIKDILDHFGYIPYVNVDGKFSVKLIDTEAVVSDTYDDSTLLLDYTPDDSYSNFTNRVVVKGEGQYFVDVTYAEESVASLAGTSGWWGCSEIKRIYYSEDKKRKCRNPVLVINEKPDINLFFIKKGGGKISIHDIDPYETWVEVKIVAPNLIVALSVAVAVAIGIGILSKGCIVNCGFYIYSISISISVISYILAATANYSFEIYAQPVGSEKETFQSKADDLESQRKYGMIITEEIDDPFCYSISRCSQVAERELAIITSQRRRVRFNKTSNLANEICDIITVPHPYTGLALTVFIAALTRLYSKPQGRENSGGLIDSIEGWSI